MAGEFCITDSCGATEDAGVNTANNVEYIIFRKPCLWKMQVAPCNWLIEHDLTSMKPSKDHTRLHWLVTYKDKVGYNFYLSRHPAKACKFSSLIYIVVNLLGHSAFAHGIIWMKDATPSPAWSDNMDADRVWKMNFTWRDWTWDV